MRTPSPKRIARALALVAILVVPLAYHARPVLVWQLEVAPALRAERSADRLHVRTLESFPGAPAGWRTLSVANLRLRAPIPSGQRAACAFCSHRCVLQIEGGTLAVFADPPDEAYPEALALFAPDADDISLMRAAAQNWNSIDGLVGRVTSRSRLPEALRFRSRASKGIVTTHTAGTSPPARVDARSVVYAYAPDGSPTRVIGLTGVDRSVLEMVLGTLVVEPQRAASGEQGDALRAQADCE